MALDPSPQHQERPLRAGQQRRLDRMRVIIAKSKHCGSVRNHALRARETGAGPEVSDLNALLQDSESFSKSLNRIYDGTNHTWRSRAWDRDPVHALVAALNLDLFTVRVTIQSNRVLAPDGSGDELSRVQLIPVLESIANSPLLASPSVVEQAFDELREQATTNSSPFSGRLFKPLAAVVGIAALLALSNKARESGVNKEDATGPSPAGASQRSVFNGQTDNFLRRPSEPRLLSTPDLSSPDGSNTPGVFGRSQVVGVVHRAPWDRQDQVFWQSGLYVINEQGAVRVDPPVPPMDRNGRTLTTVTFASPLASDPPQPPGFGLLHMPQLDNPADGSKTFRLYRAAGNDWYPPVAPSTPVVLDASPALESDQNKLRAAPSDQRLDTVRAQLANFSYVVSTQLNQMLESLPGTWYQKAATLRVGDCDMLSLYAALLLRSVGEDAAVEVGFVEKRNTIEANSRHARLRTPKEHIELTSDCKRFLVNLVFSEEDRSHLEKIIRISRENPNLPSHEVLTQFGRALELILERPDYAQFTPKEELSAPSGVARRARTDNSPALSADAASYDRLQGTNRLSAEPERRQPQRKDQLSASTDSPSAGAKDRFALTKEQQWEIEHGPFSPEDRAKIEELFVAFCRANATERPQRFDELVTALKTLASQPYYKQEIASRQGIEPESDDSAGLGFWDQLSGTLRSFWRGLKDPTSPRHDEAVQGAIMMGASLLAVFGIFKGMTKFQLFKESFRDDIFDSVFNQLSEHTTTPPKELGSSYANLASNGLSKLVERYRGKSVRVQDPSASERIADPLLEASTTILSQMIARQYNRSLVGMMRDTSRVRAFLKQGEAKLEEIVDDLLVRGRTRPHRVPKKEVEALFAEILERYRHFNQEFLPKIKARAEGVSRKAKVRSSTEVKFREAHVGETVDTRRISWTHLSRGAFVVKEPELTNDHSEVPKSPLIFLMMGRHDTGNLTKLYFSLIEDGPSALSAIHVYTAYRCAKVIKIKNSSIPNSSRAEWAQSIVKSLVKLQLESPVLRAYDKVGDEARNAVALLSSLTIASVMKGAAPFRHARFVGPHELELRMLGVQVDPSDRLGVPRRRSAPAFARR